VAAFDIGDSPSAPVTDAEGAADCGVGRPDPKLEVSELPRFAQLPRAQIVKIKRLPRFTSFSLIVPLPVKEALDVLRERLEAAGLSVLTEDYEVFEAEIYLLSAENPGNIKIIASLCADRSLIRFLLPR